jgi:hypothetical protein
LHPSSGAAGDLTQSPWFNAPWLIAGSLKIFYDVSLYALYSCGRGIRDAERSAAEKNKAGIQ